MYLTTGQDQVGPGFLGWRRLALPGSQPHTFPPKPVPRLEEHALQKLPEGFGAELLCSVLHSFRLDIVSLRVLKHYFLILLSFRRLKGFGFCFCSILLSSLDVFRIIFS